jgi:hypothetical protein
MEYPFAAYTNCFILYNVQLTVPRMPLYILIFSVSTTFTPICFSMFVLLKRSHQCFIISSTMWLCVGFCSSYNSKLFWLLFFEPLSIAFDMLQVIRSGLFEMSVIESFPLTIWPGTLFFVNTSCLLHRSLYGS